MFFAPRIHEAEWGLFRQLLQNCSERHSRQCAAGCFKFATGNLLCRGKIKSLFFIWERSWNWWINEYKVVARNRCKVWNSSLAASSILGKETQESNLIWTRSAGNCQIKNLQFCQFQERQRNSIFTYDTMHRQNLWEIWVQSCAYRAFPGRMYSSSCLCGCLSCSFSALFQWLLKILCLLFASFTSSWQVSRVFLFLMISFFLLSVMASRSTVFCCSLETSVVFVLKPLQGNATLGPRPLLRTLRA